MELQADFGVGSVHEVSAIYDVSKTRSVAYDLYETDCETPVSIGAGAITALAASTADKDSTTETLTLDYDFDIPALAASSIWNSLEEEIELCQVVQLTEGAMVIAEDIRRLNIPIGFDVDFADLGVTLADQVIGDETQATDVDRCDLLAVE